MPPSEKKIKKRIMKAKAKAKAKPKRQKQRQTQTQKIIQTIKISGGASGSGRQQNPVMPIQIHQPTAPIYHPSPHQHPNFPPIRPNPVSNSVSHPIQHTVSNPVSSTNLIKPNPVIRQVSSLPQKQTIPAHNIPDPVYVVNREISKETVPSKKPNPIAPESLQKLFKENTKNKNEYSIFFTRHKDNHIVNDEKELKAPETKSAWNVKPFTRLNNDDADNTLFPDDELTRHY